MSNLITRYTASAQLTGATFAAQPSASVAAVLAPFFKGDKGDRGEQGRDGAVGGLLKRAQFESTSYGEQELTLGSEPVAGSHILVFINGILHLDPADQSIVGHLLTLGVGMGIYPNDNITIVYQ